MSHKFYNVTGEGAGGEDIPARAMHKKTILVAGGLGLGAAMAAAHLEKHGHKVIVMGDDDYKAQERPKLREPPLIEAPYARPRKPKKDKTNLKRYSSYFNKKKS